MGEGFVVMQSNDVDIYYYQDEPGTTIVCRTLVMMNRVRYGCIVTVSTWIWV